MVVYKANKINLQRLITFKSKLTVPEPFSESVHVLLQTRFKEQPEVYYVKKGKCKDSQSLFRSLLTFIISQTRSRIVVN